MHIALIHGYLLKGTGSNLYVHNLAREFCRMGHSVTLCCQEAHPEQYDFIGSFYKLSAHNDSWICEFMRNTNYAGECNCYRPDLGGLLPVYVYDDYPGFIVKEYTDLGQEEIENYLQRNSQALQTIFRQDPPDLIISNHTIMQSVYTARACHQLKLASSHFMVVHGSALNFSVRKSLLLKEYALEGLGSVDKLIFLSEHSQREFVDFFAEGSSFRGSMHLIPGGVDMDLFRPLQAGEDRLQRLHKLYEIANDDSRLSGTQQNEPWTIKHSVMKQIQEHIDEAEALIIYYGKYLWTKGIQLLIAAAPLIWAKNPGAVFLIVGAGEFQPYLERMIDGLANGDREPFEALLKAMNQMAPDISQNPALYGGSLMEALQDEKYSEAYFRAGKRAHKQIILTGFMPHEWLSHLVACSDVAVAPSIFPEAFGLVAVEALASGIIPVQTNHSAFREIIDIYVKEFKADLWPRELKALYLNENTVINMASNINHLLDYYQHLSPPQRLGIRQRARKIAEENYSWSQVGKSLVQLCWEEKEITKSQ